MRTKEFRAIVGGAGARHHGDRGHGYCQHRHCGRVYEDKGIQSNSWRLCLFLGFSLQYGPHIHDHCLL